jgi:hypothetical protein
MLKRGSVGLTDIRIGEIAGERGVVVTQHRGEQQWPLTVDPKREIREVPCVSVE